MPLARQSQVGKGGHFPGDINSPLCILSSLACPKQNFLPWSLAQVQWADVCSPAQSGVGLQGLSWRGDRRLEHYSFIYLFIF